MNFLPKLLFCFLSLSFFNSIAQINPKEELLKLNILYNDNKIDAFILKIDSLDAINNDLFFESKLKLLKAKAMTRLNKPKEIYPLLKKSYDIGKKVKNDSIVIYSNSMIFEYFLNMGKKEEAIITINENISILINSKSPNAKAELATMYGLLSGLYDNFNETENYRKYAKLMYNTSKQIDPKNPHNARLLANIYSNYADYVNRLESEVLSFDYYVKANNQAHKVKSNYLINFTRTRIAGCLTNLNKPLQALDTLRLMQNEKHVDVYVNYLMYEGFIRAFERAKMKDSIPTYQVLFEDHKKLVEYNSGDINAENSHSENDIIIKEGNSNSYHIYILIFSFLAGIFVIVYIVKNINIKIY